MDARRASTLHEQRNAILEQRHLGRRIVPHGRSSVSIAQLIAAGYLSAGQELRLRGRDEVARIRADGSIAVKGKTYGSPSTAANAILGGHSNGWVTWRARVDGEWVTLGDLRSRYESGRSSG